MSVLPLPNLPALAGRTVQRCARCHRIVARSELVDGYGPECAELLGLTTHDVRVRGWRQDGPDLFNYDDEGTTMIEEGDVEAWT